MTNAVQLKSDAVPPPPRRPQQTREVLRGDDAQPANDAPATHELPQFILTEKSRAKFAALAARIAPAKIKPLPPYTSERLRWMGGILASAWADQSLLARVSISGDSPVSFAELDDFGHRLAYVREVVGAGNPVAALVAALSDEEVQRRTRDAQVKLCGAVPLWLEGKVGAAFVKARGAVRAVMAARAIKHLSQNTVKLLAVIDEHAAIDPWLRTLPREEGAALDDLRALHPELVRREHLAARAKRAGRAAGDRSERAWALLDAPLRRILLAGRYLTRGVPGREGAYPGFSRPKPVKPRVAKAAPISKPT